MVDMGKKAKELLDYAEILSDNDKEASLTDKAAVQALVGIGLAILSLGERGSNHDRDSRTSA